MAVVTPPKEVLSLPEYISKKTTTSEDQGPIYQTNNNIMEICGKVLLERNTYSEMQMRQNNIGREKIGIV